MKTTMYRVGSVGSALIDVRPFLPQEAKNAPEFTGFYDADGAPICDGDSIVVMPNIKSIVPPVVPVGQKGIVQWNPKLGQWTMSYLPDVDGKTSDGLNKNFFGPRQTINTALPGEIIDEYKAGFRLTLKNITE
ncbi:MAG: hypothetical protein WC455_09470 [Dehalococcoidia bacterium]